MSDGNQWHFITDGEDGQRQEGPVSTEELAALLTAGKLSTETLVWQAGMPDWVQIGTLPDFPAATPQDALSDVPAPTAGETSIVDLPEAASADEPSDLESVREFDGHSIKFSKSRNALLVVTNDPQAGPLALTKLDLLGFLTWREASSQEV